MAGVRGNIYCRLFEPGYLKVASSSPGSFGKRFFIEEESRNHFSCIRLIDDEEKCLNLYLYVYWKMFRPLKRTIRLCPFFTPHTVCTLQFDHCSLDSVVSLVS